MRLKMMNWGPVLAVALLCVAFVVVTSGCADTAQEPVKETAKQQVEQSTPDEELRYVLVQSGATPGTIEAQVKLAYTSCEMMDEMGDVEGLTALGELISQYDAETQQLATVAVAAGLVVICPEHQSALDKMGVSE